MNNDHIAGCVLKCPVCIEAKRNEMSNGLLLSLITLSRLNARSLYSLCIIRAMVALDGLNLIAMETAEISTLRLPLTRRRIYALVLVKRTLSPVGATGVTVRSDLERQVTTRRS